MKKLEYIKPDIKTIKIESQLILAGTTIQQATEEDYGSIDGDVMGD